MSQKPYTHIWAFAQNFSNFAINSSNINIFEQDQLNMNTKAKNAKMTKIAHISVRDNGRAKLTSPKSLRLLHFSIFSLKIFRIGVRFGGQILKYAHVLFNLDEIYIRV